MRTDEERDDEELIIDTGEDAEQQEAEEQGEETPEEPEDEVVIGFGDEVESEEEQGAPDWVKDVRKRNRELAAEVARLKADKGNDNQEQPVLGPKPKLVDFDYDEPAHEEALDKWYEQKRQIEAAESEAQRRQRESQEAWQAQVTAFNQNKTKLNRPDFDDAQARVEEELGVARTRAILHVANAGGFDPAAVMYALGKSPTKLQQLASIPEGDGIALVVALTKLSGSVKVIQKKKAVEPEQRVRGSAPLSQGKDMHLEKLEREAAKTGDRSKIIAYKRDQKLKAAAS